MFQRRIVSELYFPSSRLFILVVSFLSFLHLFSGVAGLRFLRPLCAAFSYQATASHLYHGIIIEVEKHHEIKDSRTLKKYLLLSLVSTGTFLEMGSRNFETCFCTTVAAKDMKPNEISSDSTSVHVMSSERPKLRHTMKVFWPPTLSQEQKSSSSNICCGDLKGYGFDC